MRRWRKLSRTMMTRRLSADAHPPDSSPLPPNSNGKLARTPSNSQTPGYYSSGAKMDYNDFKR
jgi:hypothetical protein